MTGRIVGLLLLLRSSVSAIDFGKQMSRKQYGFMRDCRAFTCLIVALLVVSGCTSLPNAARNRSSVPSGPPTVFEGKWSEAEYLELVRASMTRSWSRSEEVWPGIDLSDSFIAIVAPSGDWLLDPAGRRELTGKELGQLRRNTLREDEGISLTRLGERRGALVTLNEIASRDFFGRLSHMRSRPGLPAYVAGLIFTSIATPELEPETNFEAALSSTRQFFGHSYPYRHEYPLLPESLEIQIQRIAINNSLLNALFEEGGQESDLARARFHYESMLANHPDEYQRLAATEVLLGSIHYFIATMDLLGDEKGRASLASSIHKFRLRGDANQLAAGYFGSGNQNYIRYPILFSSPYVTTGLLADALKIDWQHAAMQGIPPLDAIMRAGVGNRPLTDDERLEEDQYVVDLRKTLTARDEFAVGRTGVPNRARPRSEFVTSWARREPGFEYLVMNLRGIPQNLARHEVLQDNEMLGAVMLFGIRTRYLKELATWINYIVTKVPGCSDNYVIVFENVFEEQLGSGAPSVTHDGRNFRCLE